MKCLTPSCALFAALLVALGWCPLRTQGQETADPPPADAEAPADAAPAAQRAPLPDDYSCILCHRKDGELWNETTPVTDESKMVNDVHWEKGLRCHDCHGGSATLEGFKNHREDPTFRSVRSRDAVPGMCGHCHSNLDYMRQFAPSARTDQESEYWTSGHGRRLKATAAGENPQLDKDVATCTDCHGHHGILTVKNPASPVYPSRVAETCARCHSDKKKMDGRILNGRPLEVGQYEQWQTSVHGHALLKKGDLSAPTCNDCHGNHGSAPPGVGSVANACGTCHGKVAKLFADAQMKHKFEESGLPGCATCHGMHAITRPTDEMIGIGDGAVCAKCHNEKNPQYGATLSGTNAARHMRERIDQLKHEIETAEATIREAERIGMEVRGPRFDLRQAFDSLTNARTLVHSFRPAPIDEALDEGLRVTATVRQTAEATLQEHTNRRIWLAASLIPLLLVVALLLLCIRRIGIPAHDT